MTYDFTFAQSQEGFDNHIDHSIRGYSNLLEDTVAFSRYFVEDHTKVVDIGCSTGKLTKMIIAENPNRQYAQYVGVELAGSFYDDMDNRYKEVRKDHPSAILEFVRGDIRNYDFKNCSLVTSIFTLQFMPKTDRQEVINRIYGGLNEGGAFIFAEKLMCEDAFFQELLTFNYYDFKRKSFTPEEIMNKEKQLRDMLKPNTWGELNRMVLSAGFHATQIFWRNHQFVGVIALK
ncbi:methyltransferase domain-containing protein [Synechococcus phage S-CRM01]|uniref:tRNA methyltransferase n=1 Tax=Synechococcus phage S-CRM01 TaxID=1026955 RepID=UPI000209E3E6|nr:tRNA methyltransferase [Synechococcus phage S-CRM01]AEC53095.1 methyltransferase domain-containing protein [Synechococcus phage S-CRM01]